MSHSGELVGCASAPGKAILFGEHSVVHGRKAIAAALCDLRVTAFVSLVDAPELRLQLDDISMVGLARHTVPLVTIAGIVARRTRLLFADDDKQSVRPTEAELSALERVAVTDEPSVHKAIMACSFLVCAIMPELVYEQSGAFQGKGLEIVVKSVNLPVGAGLGSSAAFSVSVSGAILHLRSLLLPEQLQTQVDATEVHVQESNLKGIVPAGLLKTINQWALGAEVVIHGDPSGLDNTVSCFGSAIVFNRELDAGSVRFETLEQFPPLRIALTNTRVPRETKKLVAGVRKLYESPHTGKSMACIFDAIHHISESFLDLIHSNAPEEEINTVTGQMISMNHALLNAMGVGHPALERVVAISQSLNLQCKLTGAGGGGCAITLLDHHGSAPLKHLLQQEGFELFESKLGGPGVVWHTTSAPPPAKREQPEPANNQCRWGWLAAGAAVAAVSVGAFLALGGKHRRF